MVIPYAILFFKFTPLGNIRILLKRIRGVPGIRVLSSLNIEAAGSSNDALRRHLTTTPTDSHGGKYPYPSTRRQLPKTPGRHLVF